MSQEAIAEQDEKGRADKQWERYRNEKTIATSGAPTEKQKAHIADLAERVGLRINASSVRTGEQASRVIGRLRQIEALMTGTPRLRGALQRI